MSPFSLSRRDGERQAGCGQTGHAARVLCEHGSLSLKLSSYFEQELTVDTIACIHAVLCPSDLSHTSSRHGGARPDPRPPRRPRPRRGPVAAAR